VLLTTSYGFCLYTEIICGGLLNLETAAKLLLIMFIILGRIEKDEYKIVLSFHSLSIFSFGKVERDSFFFM